MGTSKFTSFCYSVAGSIFMISGAMLKEADLIIVGSVMVSAGSIIYAIIEKDVR